MRVLAAALFPAMLCALPTLAQGVPPPPEAPPVTPRDPRTPPNSTIMAEPVALMIAACDANGDARVEQGELLPCVARSFASIDAAGAGSLGYIQFADWAERWLGDRNALPSPFEVDSDQDNRITLQELEAQFTRTFARFDRDHDGVLVRSELLTLTGGLGGRRGPEGAGGPGEGGGRGRRR